MPKKFPQIVLALLLASLSACATSYSAKPITAKVVDADTGEALEGVNVIAQWLMQDPQAGRGQGNLELMEAVTDKNGEFHFPGWGPKAIPRDKFSGTRLTNQDPAIIFFKSGYHIHAVINDSHPSMRRDPHDMGPPVRDSQWDGQVIKMKKFKGELKEYGMQARSTLTGTYYSDCEWKKMPRMIATLIKEGERLRKMGVYYGLPTVGDFEGFSGDRCGSVREFFQEYLK
jgi:hypothetical protein